MNISGNYFMKIIFFLLIFFVFTFSLYTFVDFFINDDANTIGNDKWVLTGSIGIVPISASQYTDLGLRGEMSGNIESELFGSFYFTKLDIIEENPIRIDCGIGETYSLSGIINSDFYGEMDIVNNLSYYCPSLDDFILVVNSQELGNKKLTQNIGGMIVPFNIFDKKEISINGITSLTGEKNNILDKGGNEINEIYVESNKKTILKTQINKNIAYIIRNIKAENNKYSNYIDGVFCTGNDCEINDFNNNANLEKTYYFDFTGINGDDNGYGNKGKNLKISDGSFNSSNPVNYKMDIKGKNTVIVKGGNVYIDADISNKNDSTDILTLVVKRDSNNKNNGGNIYINPNVTNIDAVLIADGSILNYNGTDIKSIKAGNTEQLRRQLYIYGSLLSSNVIGTEEVPYGSDDYNNGNMLMNNNIYDLTKLRTFQTRYASGSGTTICGGNDSLWVGYVDDSGDEVKEYSWAGKSECFNKIINPSATTKYDPVSNLRVTDKFNSLVVEYNPNIISISPLIIKD